MFPHRSAHWVVCKDICAWKVKLHCERDNKQRDDMKAARNKNETMKEDGEERS